MPDLLGFAEHDHGACRAEAVALAERRCSRGGLRLTPVRRRTLEILLEGHAAIGAYDILARLDAEGLGSAPPVAYRALGFLVEHGFAHRIERLNAFVACDRAGDVHDPAFLICRACGAVAEVTGGQPLGSAAAAAGFRVERAVVEVEGLCPACASGA
jgi:Fur family transcriptional regulator, zinc uptake regulator